MDDVWHSGLRAVMGIVVFRPGISQVGRVRVRPSDARLNAGSARAKSDGGCGRSMTGRKLGTWFVTC